MLSAMTGKEIYELPERLTISMLPGEYARLIQKNRSLIIPFRKPHVLRLKCLNCNKGGQYDIGMLAVYLNNPDKGKHDDRSIEEHAQMTGYFRCKHCNSAGNWEMPTQFSLLIMSAMMSKLASIENEHYFVGELRLFDGTAHRFATDSEEHLLSKLSQTDDPALIWDRLGNLYSKGERPELAAAAYEHAIRLDRRQSESYFSLAQLLREIGEDRQAADFYRLTISSARFYKSMKAEAFREMLAIAIQDLMHIHLNSNKSIAFLPERDELSDEENNRPDQAILELYKFELDPNTLQSFYPVAEMYMGKRRDELIYQKKAIKTKPHRETAASIETITSFTGKSVGKEETSKKQKVRHKGKWIKKK